MPQYEGQGNGAHGAPHAAGIGERVEQLSDSAQNFWSEARGAVTDLGDAIDVRGRLERHPYGTLAMAAGIGYLLGGGLFTPLTGSIVRLGIRLAALPFVKDELLAMAEGALDNLAQSSRGESSTMGSSDTRGPRTGSQQP
jgi:hypothetical protein